MKIRIAITSMVCFIVVMGMGRFALTPQLPRMMAEGQVNLTQASLLAAANFLGYLAGSFETVTAGQQHLILRLRSGLWGTVIILLFSALIPHHPGGIYMNLLLRFAAGVASAWAFVLISTWFQRHLAHDNALRTVAFAGPGVGIIITGLLALFLDYFHTSADFNWFIFGLFSLGACLTVYKNLPNTLTEMPQDKRFHLSADSYRLMVSYCLCGVGYVLPATFLSKLAVDEFPHSLVADVFWPLYGVAVIAGMAVLAVQKEIRQPQLWLTGTYVMQGLGVLACTFIHGFWGLLLGALLVGGSFLAILQLTMKLGADLAPHHLRAMTGVLTTAFAVGQFIGPLLSAMSTHLWGTLVPALCLAAFGSFFAAFLVYLIRSHKEKMP